jgi:hypothetical protein
MGLRSLISLVFFLILSESSSGSELILMTQKCRPGFCLVPTRFFKTACVPVSTADTQPQSTSADNLFGLGPRCWTSIWTPFGRPQLNGQGLARCDQPELCPQNQLGYVLMSAQLE